MNELISPKYQMHLVQQVNDKIWEEYKTYKNVLFYIKKWHEEDEPSYYQNDRPWENFYISYLENKIDLKTTLHNMNGDILLKIAIDLNVDTPDFIPSIPTFKNRIKEEYTSVYDTFTKALKQIEEDPALALGLANSAFESLIKEILKDERFSCKLSGGETLYKLTQIVLKEFKIVDNFPTEAKTISTSLLSIAQMIEKLRSEKSLFHGKTTDDVLIDDSIYVYLVVNAFTTVGLFLDSYYKKRYPQLMVQVVPPNYSDDDDLPF